MILADTGDQPVVHVMPWAVVHDVATCYVPSKHAACYSVQHQLVTR